MWKIFVINNLYNGDGKHKPMNCNHVVSLKTMEHRTLRKLLAMSALTVDALRKGIIEMRSKTIKKIFEWFVNNE